ncbi:uncharacterized protein BCR38DRAFT_485618 [Pseudomassariella vexata]|uniref:Myb-like DNA-binding domain-containing protein n=1 Tax=Pseudomassariella vexata TaxID=1141098 RepID=A0A1Y2DYV4_9PEZI|nr:uncharacterized protein BCR38DRAFT_485618 [Pseudomassariella vexata]ORY64472.1 hypothetical protein BCR38DRAFT_485618 [Pseudomassariella vexata]
MVAPHDTESQFAFLISCIKNSTAGKVDFEQVRKDCNIISKGAAAKRYERLLRAHGIANGGTSSKTPVKKEDGPATPATLTKKPRTTKKRKLAAVDENAGDVDEPKVKGEVKSEDASTVKLEQGNGVLASIPAAVSNSFEETPAAVAAADDDDVLLISATERRPNSIPACSSSGDHHHSPNPMIPGCHSFDCAANMGFSTQTSPMMATTMLSLTSRPSHSHQTHPYGFGTSVSSPWFHTHDGSGIYWQNTAPENKEAQYQ